jgi:hypothetical protein
MNGAALSILRKVAARYDVTIDEALAMAPRKCGDYRDQYPLAMLVEGEYLGFTMEHIPPEGAEKMREYSQAIMLHAMSLKKKEDGSVAPAAVFFDGSKENVFLKAKGALYLDEIRKKRWDRFYSLLFGVLLAICGLWLKSTFEKKPTQAPEPTAPSGRGSF